MISKFEHGFKTSHYYTFSWYPGAMFNSWKNTNYREYYFKYFSVYWLKRKCPYRDILLWPGTYFQISIPQGEKYTSS